MLDGLIDYLQSEDLPDDPFVRTDSVAFGEGTVDLVVSVLSYDQSESWARWRIRAIGVIDYRLSDPCGDLSLHESDHVLARQHTEAHQALYFSGSSVSPPRTVGRLFATHTARAGFWIPFERYLNPCCRLEELIAAKTGMLADGPFFLVSAYADVLANEGLKPSVLAPRPAQHWDGQIWTENASPLATLIIGDSFFVARTFEEERP